MTSKISTLRALAGVLLAVVLCGVAPAGTVQLTAHAHDSTGELHITKNASHPTLAYADTGNVNKPGAHARSWGAAIVSGGSLKKSAGGEGWVLNGNSTKHQYWYANAGTGEFIVEAPPGVNSARLRLLIEQTGNVIDPAQPLDAPPEIGAYPSQAVFAEYDFSVQVKLDATVEQGVEKSDLFHGRALFGGPENAAPGLQSFGDFATLNVFELIQFPGNPGQVRLGALVPDAVIAPSSASVLTNIPFTLNLDLIMSQYAIDSFPFEPPLVDTGGILAASSGDLVVEIFVEDDLGNLLTITPVVPEPSSLALAALGAMGLFLARRQRIRWSRR